jgi:hypothetical protein
MAFSKNGMDHPLPGSPSLVNGFFISCMMVPFSAPRSGMFEGFRVGGGRSRKGMEAMAHAEHDIEQAMAGLVLGIKVLAGDERIAVG